MYRVVPSTAFGFGKGRQFSQYLVAFLLTRPVGVGPTGEADGNIVVLDRFLGPAVDRPGQQDGAARRHPTSTIMCVLDAP